MTFALAHWLSDDFFLSHVVPLCVFCVGWYLTLSTVLSFAVRDEPIKLWNFMGSTTITVLMMGREGKLKTRGVRAMKERGGMKL